MSEIKDPNKAALKLLNKLFEAGINTDNAVLNLTMAELGAIPNLAVSDIPLLSILQQCIKDKKVIAFLGGMVD